MTFYSSCMWKNKQNPWKKIQNQMIYLEIMVKHLRVKDFTATPPLFFCPLLQIIPTETFCIETKIQPRLLNWTPHIVDNFTSIYGHNWRHLNNIYCMYRHKFSSKWSKDFQECNIPFISWVVCLLINSIYINVSITKFYYFYILDSSV